MRLKKRLESFNKFFTEEPIIENIEPQEILNEDTEGYSEGKAYGTAFQAAIVLGIAVMIAVTRARARMKKKMAWYKKAAPQRAIMEADKRLVEKRYSFEREEQIDKLVQKQAEKVKKIFKKKKAEYAANADKTQGELEQAQDKGYTSIVAMQDEKINALRGAATEKLDRMKKAEILQLDRSIEDWDAKWKEIQEKLDPSELFQKIAGQKGLGGVTATFNEWKIQEDRKIADDTLEYELGEYDNYIEDDEDLKKIKAKKEESHKKFLKEVKAKEQNAAEKLAKAQEETEDLEKEQKDHMEEYPDAEIAAQNQADFQEAIQNWQASLKSVIAKKVISKEQAAELKELEEVAVSNEGQLSVKDYESLTKDPSAAEDLKEKGKKMVDQLSEKQKEFLEEVRGKQEKLEGDIENAKKQLDNMEFGSKERAEKEKEIATMELQIGKMDNDEDRIKQAEKDIKLADSNIKDAEENEKESNTNDNQNIKYTMNISCFVPENF